MIEHFVMRATKETTDELLPITCEWVNVDSISTMRSASEIAQQRHWGFLAYRFREHGYMLVNDQPTKSEIQDMKGYHDGGIPVESVSIVYLGPTFKDGTFTEPRNMRVLHGDEWYDCHPPDKNEKGEWVWPVRYECWGNDPKIYPLTEDSNDCDLQGE